jgi:hypothetical protein
MKMPGVPAKSMFAIRGIGRVISEEAAKYEELRLAIIEEFGERDDKNDLVKIGNNIKIRSDKIKDMNHKLKEIASIEVKIPEIKFVDLGENPPLTSEDIFQLEFIVE